jgi:glutathione S-transferase
MKLHHIPGSRSCRARWLLEELGVDYELESHRFGEASLGSPAYRALNPLGLVPTLEDDECVFFESGAIVQYLLERHAGGRLEPAPGTPDRARFLQWLHWGEATLMPPLGVIMRNRFVLPEADRSAAALDSARRHFGRVLGVLAEAVADSEALVADRFSAADIVVAYGLWLARAVAELPEEFGGLHAYLEALSGRPAFERVGWCGPSSLCSIDIESRFRYRSEDFYRRYRWSECAFGPDGAGVPAIQIRG